MDKSQLKAAGLKLTVPRVKILGLLGRASERHLSAEDIYRQLADEGVDVGLATVYRVLTQFESAGIVIRHHFEGGHSVFELNEGEHHDHLVCVKCQKVIEFHDEIIETRQETIAKEHRYQMLDHCLNIYGVCPDCQG